MTRSNAAGNHRGRMAGAIRWALSLLCALAITAVHAQPGRAPDSAQREPNLLPPKMTRRIELAQPIVWRVGDNPTQVKHSDAKWIQVHFNAGKTKLGTGSTVKLIHPETGDSQTLDSIKLAQWNYTSAQFPGGVLEIDVEVALGDEQAGVTVVIDGITVDNPVSPERPPATEVPPPNKRDLCKFDNRIPDSDPAVGRITGAYCTGWIISNGAFLTAGHCVGKGVAQVQFQVPASLSDGTPQPPTVGHTYPVNTTAISHAYVKRGTDWALFGTYPNSESGKQAVHVQEAFYRLSKTVAQTGIVLVGYGLDNSPPSNPATNEYNVDSLTLQRSPYVKFANQAVLPPSWAVINFWAHCKGGLSGSPIIDSNSGLAMGITTNECLGTVTAAGGTGFANQDLATAIETFPGLNVVYVDRDHPVTTESGSIFEPWDTLPEGVLNAVADDTLSIVTGTYAVPERYTISKPLTLTAPVGAVTIQQE